ncbi:hypothetical protein BC332_31646 [Capsicum chinense]|nr:hypothetical protein BC332_31646 [Capsicum chinense]
MMKSLNVMAKEQAGVGEVFKGRKTCDDETTLEKLNYLKSVIKETLKIHPPTPLLVSREFREEIQIDGFTIPLKSKVLVNVWCTLQNGTPEIGRASQDGTPVIGRASHGHRQSPLEWSGDGACVT